MRFLTHHQHRSHGYASDAAASRQRRKLRLFRSTTLPRAALPQEYDKTYISAYNNRLQHWQISLIAELDDYRLFYSSTRGDAMLITVRFVWSS
jgi:hypothetical protein